MSMLKIKNQQGGWDEIIAIRGRDGAIQYTAGANIEISPENVISAVGLENTVTREDVAEMIGAAVPQDVSDLNNDAGYITSSDVPTKTSDLTNDSGFITSSSLPTKTSDLTNDSGFITSGDIPAEQEPAFQASVARTITQADINNWNQKQNPIQFNTAYNATSNKAATMADVPAMPTKLSDLTNDAGYALRSELPTVPANVSDFNNDAGYVTSANIPTKTSDLTNDSNYATLSDIPSVPTKLSELTNDAGYLVHNDVGDGVLTIKRNNTSLGTFHANAATNNSINIAVPTATSELTNNSGFITIASVPTKTSQLTNDSGFINESVVNSRMIQNYRKKINLGVNNLDYPSGSMSAKGDITVVGTMARLRIAITFVNMSYGLFKMTDSYGFILLSSISNTGVQIVSGNSTSSVDIVALVASDMSITNDSRTVPFIGMCRGSNNTTKQIRFRVELDSSTNNYILKLDPNTTYGSYSGDDFPYVSEVQFETWVPFPYVLAATQY